MVVYPTTRTQDTIIYVTTLPHRGRVGPPPSKGVAKTSNPRHNKGNETSQPTPRRKSGVRGVGSY